MNNSVQFLGNETSDWLNISASNPIDTLSLTINDNPNKLIEFVKEYDGKFLTGFISYEYGAKQLGAPVHDIKGFPAVYFRAYDSYDEKPIIADKQKNVDWNYFQPHISKEVYDSQFNKIQSHIKSGDFYQINYTHQLTSKTAAAPRELFFKLRENNQVGFSAFMEDSNWAIHSLSPEQFIKIENGLITTKPIKGTYPRGLTNNEDEQNINALINSEKEQAELYMIIDLLRNDLGKICKTGSVNVLESKSVEKLKNVFHTYGVIQGQVKEAIHPVEALLSMSPGGSISGCPKKRACEIIYELETEARGIYTGTIGYILPNGSLHFNIAIRTITQVKTHLTLGVGGGITIGSDLENEYNETLIKATSLQP